MTDRSRYPLRYPVLAATIFAASLLPKTFVFAGHEPVVLNYVVTTLLLGLGAVMMAPRMAEIPFDKLSAALLLLAIVWAAFSGFQSGMPLNVVAAITFAITAIGSGFIVPALLFLGRREPSTMVRNQLAIMSVGSMVLLIVDPASAVDPESGRIGGIYLSVAIASPMLGFALLLALRSALVSTERIYIWLWSAIAFVSLMLLYLTRTRSTLIEVLLSALVLVTFTPLSRGVRLVVSSFTALLLIAVAAAGLVVSTGAVLIDDQLAEFRLADSSLHASRDDNWTFGIERIVAKPLFGEGLLAKQTQGGASGVDLASANSYDPRYDPHSLILSFGVEGGIPFIILMTSLFILIPARFVRAFGWRTALQTPEFVLAVSRLTVSIFSGGDMTALGNVVEKTTWILLGSVMLKAELKLRMTAPTGQSLRTDAASPRPWPTMVRHSS